MTVDTTANRLEVVNPQRHILRPGVIFLVALSTFVVILLRGSLSGRAMLSYDLFVYFFPAKQVIRDAFGRGEWPLWNPDIFFGAPFLANIQMAVLYPPDLVFVVTDFATAVALSQGSHLVTIGLGMYALARRGWGLRPWGAVLGATMVTGSGFLGAHLGHLNQVHAATWLPWVALCINRVANAIGQISWHNQAHATRAELIRNVARWGVFGGIAIALLITAGHTQEAYYALIAIGIEALLFTVIPPVRTPKRIPHLLGVAFIVALGLGLASAQLIPTLEISLQGYRVGGMSRDEAGAYAVDRTHLLETFLPTYWNLPAQETTGYVGTVALPFVIVALVISPARRQVLALLAIAAFALVVSFGVYTPAFDYLLAYAPLFASFRAPGRWLFIWTFAIAGLAAHGLDALVRDRKERCENLSPALARTNHERGRDAVQVALAFGAMALVIGLIVARTALVGGMQWLPPGRAALVWLWCGTFGATGAGVLVHAHGALRYGTALLVLIVTAGELVLAGHRMEYAFTGLRSLYERPPAIVEYAHSHMVGARDDASPPRLVSLTVEQHLDAQRLAASVGAVDDDTRRYRAMQDALKPDLGMVYRLPTIDGYDGGLLPLRTYARFKAVLLNNLAQLPVPHLTLAAEAQGRADADRYAALGIGVVISDGRNGSPGENWRTIDDAPGAAWWHENRLAISSRALLIGHVVVEEDPDRTLATLRSIDLRATAIVANAMPGLTTGSVVDAPRLPSADEVVSVGTARVVRYASQKVEIEVVATRRALLVLTDTDYPGWEARLDGQVAPIVRVDGLFRGVALEAGVHHVEFVFAPWSWRIGIVVSFLTSALMVGMILMTRGLHVRGWRRLRHDAPRIEA